MSHPDRPFLRIALIGALIASVGLTACGRKGPLDPPPGSSLTGAQVTPTSTDKPVYGPDKKVLVPAGVKKPIPLDVLLN